MKLREVFERIDRCPENEDAWVELETFASTLSISAYFDGSKYDLFQQRVTGYWVDRWRCTDTDVGSKVFFLDGRPLAFATKCTRKSDWYLQFVSEEIVQELRSFIQSLIEPDELTHSYISLDDEVGDVYHLMYAEQIPAYNKTRGMIGNERVKILGPIEPGYCVYWVKIENERGENSVARLECIDFPIHVE